DSYEALAADPEVDAVYIATPHRYHREQALLCLEAGKAVLCEKPLTVNAAETAALIELARAKNVFLMEALWTRYLPVYRHVREWLDAGLIGDVELISSTFGFAMTRDPNDRILNHELAGGGLLDLGVYNVAMSQWVMGRDPVEIAAQARIGETNVDELTSASLRYDDGSVSQFTCTIRAGTANEFAIYGRGGHIRVHNIFCAATAATLVTAGKELTVSEPFRATGFEYQIEEAMRCMQAGLLESPSMTHAQSLANMTTMDRIRAAIGLRYSFE
ncbi:MAG TPA: Gfo/Idh/MocA family oxidoreductase, partial [Herpetosiphonaceae bacterium]|nr:Gfo/Idh/MocA family oxidoreductase [Herpetosiphonaceae bacterium]